jgi:2'-5' RNA ligase
MTIDLTTTVNIVLPPRLQAHVVALHRQYQLAKPMNVPAHFTVLHPFVHYELLGEGVSRLRRVCAELSPFEIVADGYGTFPGVVYLAARDPEPIRVASRALCAEFPECPLYGGEFGPELSPHATIVEGDIDAQELLHLMPPYEPVSFTARELHVYYGNEQITPWLTTAIVPFGRLGT